MIATIALAILGLCLGSFVNAFVWRIRNKHNWVSDRSMCVHCRHILAPMDLIPVVSWLTLGGKCRYCRKPISVQYPLVELITAGLFVASYLWWPAPFDANNIFLIAVWLFMLIGLMALVVYDYRWMLLPNKIIYPLIGVAIVSVLVQAALFGNSLEVLRGAVMGLLAAALPFYVLFQVSQGRWIGGGDVKLGILIGLLVMGFWQGLLVIFLASLIGMIVILPGMVAGKVKATSRIPFGPFLILALILVRLFGAAMVVWYKQRLMLSVG